MKQVTGDIWPCARYGPLGIPTNGYITKKGLGVMGRGVALQAKQRYPDTPFNLGKHLQHAGNTVGWIQLYPIRLLAIPVKPIRLLITNPDEMEQVVESVRSMYQVGSEVPGFHCKADPKIIRRSLNDLLMFMIKNSLERVFIPRLGCGNGGLDYKKDFLPILQELDLPDSIVLVHPTGNWDD